MSSMNGPTEKIIRLGFTVIELLAAVLVIATLLAIVIPALASSRRTGTAIKCLTHARSSGIAIFAYQADFKDVFPFQATSLADPSFDNGGLALPYFYQAQHWPLAAKGYLCGQSYCQTQLCPGTATFQREYFTPGNDTGYPESYVFPSDYWLSFTFFTEAARWRAGADPNDLALRRPVRLTEVANPSQKGMLLEVRAYHLQGDQNGAASTISVFAPEGQRKAYTNIFVDGHGAQLVISSMNPGLNVAGAPTPVLTTENGFLGRDVP